MAEEAEGWEIIAMAAMEARGALEWCEGMLNASLSLFSFAGVAVAAKLPLLLVEVELDPDPETRMVDVIVPYTVLFLNVVSGFNVTVAGLLAVSNSTSVVWMAMCCSQATSTACFPAAGLRSLGFWLLLLGGDGFWRLEWGCFAVATLLFRFLCFCFWFMIAEEASAPAPEAEEAETVPFLTPTNPVGASIHLVVLVVKTLVLVSVFVVVACSQTVLVPNLVSVM
jgi:hypothetical protein